MAELDSGTDLIPAARRDGDVVWATVQGEIDLHNSPEFRLALLEVLLGSRPLPRKVVLDIGRVDSMDSSAIAVLVETLRKLRPSGGKMVLVGSRPLVRSVLEIARLDTFFILARDEAEARAA